MGFLARHRRAIATAVLGSASLAALIAYSRREVRRGEAAFPPAGRFVELADGTRVHVVEDGEGPPVIAIHGADGVALSFTETVMADVAGTHRLIVFDRPGHGWSALPEGAEADVATNVAVIREALGSLGVERPIVVGHSYGGLVALTWALEHPAEVRALVLLAPVAAFPWPAPAWVLRVADLPVLGTLLTDALVVPVGRAVVGPLDRRAFLPHAVPALYTAYSRAMYLRPAQFRALAAEYANLPSDVRAISSRLGELAMPVEIVAAEGDRVTRLADHARPLAEAVPGARLTSLPDAGHEFMWARPDAIADAVRRAEERSG
ncbi:MAG TPA: alpha/beta hydrolase [Coriobacteriia bacterium]